MDTATKQKLEFFLTAMIKEKDLALALRRFTMETVKMVLSATDDQVYNKDWISDGHYYLTELCEILDPQLEDNKK